MMSDKRKYTPDPAMEAIERLINKRNKLQEENKLLRRVCQRLANAKRTKWAYSDSSNEPYIVTDSDVQLAIITLKEIDSNV